MQSAPWYSVPTSAIASVEHPFIIHNVAKAVDSLGGPVMLAKVRNLETESGIKYRSLTKC